MDGGDRLEKGSNSFRAWSGLMERAEAVPAAGAGRARAVLSCAASSTGTGTRQAGPGHFRTVLSRTVLVPARLNRSVWPSILSASMQKQKPQTNRSSLF